jgi:hypothetical protein
MLLLCWGALQEAAQSTMQRLRSAAGCLAGTPVQTSPATACSLRASAESASRTSSRLAPWQGSTRSGKPCGLTVTRIGNSPGDRQQMRSMLLVEECFNGCPEVF